MMNTIAYIDCSMGVSGDLLLSALFDAGLTMTSVQDALELVTTADGYQVQPTRAQQQGLGGTRLTIAATNSTAHYSLAEWEVRLRAGRLRQPLLACLRSLIEAEAAISSVPIGTIRVSSSTLYEMLAVLAGLHELAPGGVFVSPLPLSSGVVEKEQQYVPVLSPVTLEILRHRPAIWQSSTLPGELITPAAAALLATCARFDPPAMSIERTAYGLGAAERNWSGALRLCFGRSVSIGGEMAADAPEAVQMADTDQVAVIETNLDTMTGELLGGLMERLFSAGALDVTYTPIQMKKNRPATQLSVMCAPELGEQLALLLLRETTTLGVRIQHIRRLKARREQVRIESEMGSMLVKVKRLGGQLIHAAPEYEECQRIAKAHNIPLSAAYEVARSAIKNAIIDKERKD